jgi:NTP-dependent ternary system trypsin peptidase co-occuring protein
MSDIVQVSLPDGESIWARVSPPAGARDVGFATRSAEFAAGEVAKLARAVIGIVRDAVGDQQADEISVDFGIELSAKTGKVIGVLGEVGGTSSIVVHMTWRDDPGRPGQPRGDQRPAGDSAIPAARPPAGSA